MFTPYPKHLKKWRIPEDIRHHVERGVSDYRLCQKLFHKGFGIVHIFLVGTAGHLFGPFPPTDHHPFSTSFVPVYAWFQPGTPDSQSSLYIRCLFPYMPLSWALQRASISCLGYAGGHMGNKSGHLLTGSFFKNAEAFLYRGQPGVPGGWVTP